MATQNLLIRNRVGSTQQFRHAPFRRCCDAFFLDLLIWAALLFADGRSRQRDDTTILKQNPARGIDPGNDWMW